MALYTYFTHGNAVVAETVGGANAASPGPLTQANGIPWSDVVGFPLGYGKTYRGKAGSNVWFHAPLTTPAVLASEIVVLRTLLLQLSLDGAARLTTIDLWDANRRITTLAGLALTGDLTGDFVSGRNLFELGQHRMAFGLGVSMNVSFSGEANVNFACVGASFQSGV